MKHIKYKHNIRKLITNISYTKLFNSRKEQVEFTFIVIENINS